jgi:predicted negative regulator of RcsB-dependent stress response
VNPAAPRRRFAWLCDIIRTMVFVPRHHRASFAVGIVLTLAAMWAWERYEQHRQEQADRASVEYMEQQRVAGIVQRREAESKDLIAEVQRRLDAGEAPELVKTWSDQPRKDIQAEALRELEWK